MTPHNELRLLPWSGTDGKPCFLSTDDNGGPLSRLADRTEAAQLDTGAELVEHALEVLADGETKPEEFRLLATDLAGALRDTLRVAESRGRRLLTPAATPCEDAEGPRLPAAAFG
ncbi:hypothetical protein GCM10010275_07770 [Streptomyces litmocidini]|uniref:hypothetical protein n=1 Tax=Streptomyces litmocidini TaxID=67318 RepID=UPI00167E15A4|nr:hypothetical protein [Streptomyces litmocidini]GGU75856.1 hypothetical protein GCM10010275_07770 [Streptomyces litmocidini]